MPTDETYMQLALEQAALAEAIDEVPIGCVIVCAGQLSKRDLFDQLQQAGVRATLVGGAFEAAELDAKQAINQATELAAAV